MVIARNDRVVVLFANGVWATGICVGGQHYTRMSGFIARHPIQIKYDEGQNIPVEHVGVVAMFPVQLLPLENRNWEVLYEPKVILKEQHDE